MSKIFGLVVLLFIAFADSCSNVLSYGNVIITVNYLGKTSTRSNFQLTYNNSMPGQTPNDLTNANIDVHSFAFVDPATTGVIPQHLDFASLMGGAQRALSFSVPNSMAGAGQCLTMGFIYNKNGEEYYFTGPLSLATSSHARDVEDVAEVNNNAARSTCDTDISIPNLSTPFSGSTTSLLYNSYYWKTGTLAVSSISYNATEVSGALVTSYGVAHTWASDPANTQKSGSVGWDCYTDATYNISVQVTYTCSSNVYTAQFFMTLYCGTGGFKRAVQASVEDTVTVTAPATIRADYAVAVASAGIAVAAVAVVAAVVIVRRRKAEQIL